MLTANVSEIKNMPWTKFKSALFWMYFQTIRLILSGRAYFLRSKIKVNQSRYIALFVASGSIKKLFLIDYVNIYLFSIFFSIYFVRWKMIMSIFILSQYVFQQILPVGKVQGFHHLALISRKRVFFFKLACVCMRKYIQI